MSKIISTKVWLNLAKNQAYTYSNMPKTGTKIHFINNKLTLIIQLLIMVSKNNTYVWGLAQDF